MRLQRLLLFAPLWLACRDITGSAGDLLVTTDQMSYRAADDSLAPVRLRLENEATVALDIPRCGTITVYVDRWTGSQWVEVDRYGELCPAIYDMSPLRLGPGRTHETSPIRLGAGRYRVRVPFGRVGDDVRARSASSNVFTIEPAP